LFLIALDLHSAAFEEREPRRRAWLQRRADRIAKRLEDGLPPGWRPPLSGSMTAKSPVPTGERHQERSARPQPWTPL
jgi:hypothetical protein